MELTEKASALAGMFPPNYAREMSTDLTLDHYKELTARWTAAREQVNTLRTKLNEATATEQALADEVAAVEAVIAKALAAYREPDVLDERFGTAPSAHDEGDSPEPESSRVETPDGIRPSFYELMALIPLDGDVGIDVFRENLKLSDGALSTRIIKAKQAKLIETAGRGRYRLTEHGRGLMKPRLRVVQ